MPTVTSDIEAKLTAQRKEQEWAGQRLRHTAGGTVQYRCTECEAGWIVKDGQRLVCRTCGYLRYLE